jgi:proteic killer suppression protein
VLSWLLAVIHSFGDVATGDVFHGVNSRAARTIPRELWAAVRRKLDMLNAATSTNALRVPPGNRLEALKGDRVGSFSIRVNDQYRITFRFEREHARDVRCEDYHRG